MQLGKKAIQRAFRPQNVGSFTQEAATAKQMRLASSSFFDRACGYGATLSLLVDENDGVIADGRFQAFGPPALIAALDGAVEVLLRKNYDQAQRLTADLIDKQLQGHEKKAAFPEAAGAILNQVLELIDEAAGQCLDIPVADSYVAPPEMDLGEATQYPGFESLTDAQKQGVISGIMETEVQPYVELDAGGVTVQKVEGNKVTIAYTGNCTSCYSATGATLESIQKILQIRVHPSLIVVPDLSLLTQG
jgi:NifU-like protein